jgi:hypothetical protein
MKEMNDYTYGTLFPLESDNIISMPLCLTAAKTDLDDPMSIPIMVNEWLNILTYRTTCFHM